MTIPLTGPEGLAARLAPSIAADELTRSTEIPEHLLEQLRKEGALRLLTPVEQGGLEVPLVTALEVYEELGRLDASVAWIVWNANFGFLAAMLPPSGVARIWSGERADPVFANSGWPMTAVAVEGGHRVSGHWRLVSGIRQADWVAVAAVVMDEGVVKLRDDGNPDVRFFVVPTRDVTVLPTWTSSGLRATGSHDVVMDDVVVPEDLSFALDQVRIDRPLYRGFIPALVLPGCTAVVLGVAQSAIDETVSLALAKKTVTGMMLSEIPRVQTAVASSQAALSAARLLLFHVVRQITEAGPAVTVDQRAALRAAMSHAAQTSRLVLMTMYETASSTALYLGSPLERMFRDGMVALQHANHAAAAFEGVGRVRFGLDAGLPGF